MYKSTFTNLSAALVLSILAAACTLESNGPESDMLSFNISILSDSGSATKSSISASDETITSLHLFLVETNGGRVTNSFDFSTGSGVYSAKGIKRNKTYIVYALANCNLENVPSDKSDLENAEISIVSPEKMSLTGLPMAGSSAPFTYNEQTASVDITLERLMSKLILKIDDSDMKGSFTVRKVTLHNAPSKVSPFRANSRVSDDAASLGDAATSVDIYRLNNGNSITLLAGENMQGTLLRGNTDPWKKVPDNIPEKKDCCTYLSVSGDYNDGGLSIFDVCYKMYLGENSTDNFDIRRNCIYEMTLYLSDSSAVLASSWKVGRGVTQDSREISFDILSDTLDQCSSTTRKISCRPVHFDFDIIPGDGFKEAGFSFKSNNDGTVTVSSGSIEGKSATGRLVARSWDGARSCWCDFTVIKWDTIVRVNNGKPLLLWAGDTVSFDATVFHKPKGITENITGKAFWEFNCSNGCILGATSDGQKLKYTSQQLGTDLISASYWGRKSTIPAITSTTKEVFIEPKDTTLHVGDSLALRGYVVFNSGDTLNCDSFFDYLTSSNGCLIKKQLNSNVIYAQKAGTGTVMAILKKDMKFNTTCRIIVEE